MPKTQLRAESRKAIKRSRSVLADVQREQQRTSEALAESMKLDRKLRNKKSLFFFARSS